MNINDSCTPCSLLRSPASAPLTSMEGQVLYALCLLPTPQKYYYMSSLGSLAFCTRGSKGLRSIPLCAVPGWVSRVASETMFSLFSGSFPSTLGYVHFTLGSLGQFQAYETEA